jgi:hypothetical protein
MRTGNVRFLASSVELVGFVLERVTANDSVDTRALEA